MKLKEKNKFSGYFQVMKISLFFSNILKSNASQHSIKPYITHTISKVSYLKLSLDLNQKAWNGGGTVV